MFFEYKSRLPKLDPQINNSPLNKTIEDNKVAKADKAKAHMDKYLHTKPHNFKVGDKVLVKQQKTHKRCPYYIPVVFTIKDIKGTMITATSKDRTITRNVSIFKKWEGECAAKSKNNQQIRQSPSTTKRHVVQQCITPKPASKTSKTEPFRGVVITINRPTVAAPKDDSDDDDPDEKTNEVAPLDPMDDQTVAEIAGFTEDELIAASASRISEGDSSEYEEYEDFEDDLDEITHPASELDETIGNESYLNNSVNRSTDSSKKQLSPQPPRTPLSCKNMSMQLRRRSKTINYSETRKYVKKSK